jgi:hypothetical protein
MIKSIVAAMILVMVSTGLSARPNREHDRHIDHHKQHHQQHQVDNHRRHAHKLPPVVVINQEHARIGFHLHIPRLHCVVI